MGYFRRGWSAAQIWEANVINNPRFSTMVFYNINIKKLTNYNNRIRDKLIIKIRCLLQELWVPSETLIPPVNFFFLKNLIGKKNWKSEEK